MGILGQVLYLIVSIPYLCILFYCISFLIMACGRGIDLLLTCSISFLGNFTMLKKKKMTSYVVIFCFLLAMQADTRVEAGYGKLINTFKTHTFNAARK